MSIQKNSYTSKKTGKTRIQYYASVWFAEEKRPIIGQMRSTEKQARQDETDIQREIENGRAKPTPKSRKTTVNEIYTEWNKATAPPVYSNNTWQVYKRYYADYIKEAFGNRSAALVQPIHIQKYVNIMVEKKYSPEVVNKCLSILSDIFTFARDVLKCVTENPVTGIKRCKVPTKKKEFWRDDMIEYFLGLPEVQASHYYPMFCVSCALGPRPGEVCGLRDDCLITGECYMLDLDRGYDNYEQETDMKTTGSHRQPPIPKFLYKQLQKRLVWKKECRLLNPEWGNNDYLFVSQRGNPIKPKQYNRAFTRLIQAHNAQMKKYVEEHGKLPEGGRMLPYIPIYRLRTSFATNNMRKKPNAALISSIMGNSPKTLIQFYTQTDTEMQKELLDDYLRVEIS